MPKVFLTTTEMADILGVCRKTALELMHKFERDGKVIRVGHDFRIRKSVLEQWLFEQDGVKEKL